MRDYSDDPPIVDPEVGIWGDQVPDAQETPEQMAARLAAERRAKQEEDRIRAYHRAKRDREDAVGRDFNRYMIDLYNEARRRT